MGENLHDIDKLFRDSIEDHEEMPSRKVWDGIDNNLDKTNIIQIKKRYNNFKRIAIILILLLLGTVIYQLQTKTTGKGLVNEQDKNDNRSTQKTGTKTTAAVENKTGRSILPMANDKIIAGNKEVKDAVMETSNTVPQQLTGKTAGAGNAIDKTSAKENNSSLQTGKTVRDKLVVGADKTFAEKTTAGSFKNIGIKDDITTNADEITTKAKVKKSTIATTKISVKNGRTAELIVDGSTATGVNNNQVALTALQNVKAEKIQRDASHINAEAINNKSLTPGMLAGNNAATKNKKDKSNQSFHFNLMPFYNPQYSYTRIEDEHYGQGPAIPGNGREDIKRAEKSDKASSFGILVQVPLSKRWAVQTGVSYVTKSIVMEPKKVFAKLDNDGKIKYRFDCSSGYTFISPKTGTNPAVGDSASALSSTNKLQYISVPLAVSYKFSAGKFDIMPTVGGAVNFAVKQKIETEILQGSVKERETTRDIHGLKSTYYNALAAVAVDYNISKRIAVNLTPTANFALSSINKDAAVKSYPNSLGVAVGIKIKF